MDFHQRNSVLLPASASAFEDWRDNQSSILQEGCRPEKGEGKEGTQSVPLMKPIPVYRAYNPYPEEVTTPSDIQPVLETGSSGTIEILPQFSHAPEENLLYMTILPYALDSFNTAADEIQSFDQIWRHVIKENSDARPAMELFHTILKMDNHHFCRWPLGRGTACVYYKRHSLSQVVIAPDKKRSTTIATAFKYRNITPKFYSALNQNTIPSHHKLPIYRHESGRTFSYQDDAKQFDFLKTHLIKTITGATHFVPFAIKWKAPEEDNEIPKLDKEYCDQMEAKVEAAVMERLIEYPSATYRRIILSIRKWFPDLPIDELKRIMERLVQKESLMVKIGHDKNDGTIFKVGNGTTPAVIRRVQKMLADRGKTALIIGIKSPVNDTPKPRNPANSCLQMGRGSAAGTNISQSQMDTRGNQTAEPIIASLHNLTENQFSIEISQPCNKTSGSEFLDWSIMDSGNVNSQQRSSKGSQQPEKAQIDSSSPNVSIAGVAPESSIPISTEEMASSSLFLDDFPDIFEQNSLGPDLQLKVNNLHYTDSEHSSGNWPHRPAPIHQEGFTEPFWNLPSQVDGQGQREGQEQFPGRELGREEDVIAKEKTEPTFKVPKGRAPRRKRTINDNSHNNESESSKRQKEYELDEDFFNF